MCNAYIPLRCTSCDKRIPRNHEYSFSIFNIYLFCNDFCRKNYLKFVLNLYNLIGFNNNTVYITTD